MTRLPRSRQTIRLLTGAMLLWSLCGSPAVLGQGKASGHIAPNFSRKTLDNTNFALSSLRGKVVLLNFWASWCAPCRIEMPAFADWQRRYGAEGLQIVGVSMDDEERDALAAYQRYKLDYPVVMGDAKLGELYGGILGLPVTFLIDRNGTIQFKHQGAINLSVTEGELKTLLQKHGGVQVPERM